MSKRLIFIMAGGKGERFWPYSRQSKPKHLLPIIGDKSMLSQTIDRLLPLAPIEDIYVVTNQSQCEEIIKTCPEILPNNIICEPVGRDTSAAVGLAMLIAEQRDPNAVFAMLPADACIKNIAKFDSAMESAFNIASNNDVFVTLGIPPHFPATGYGYIKQGNPFGDTGACSVEQFVEKPNLEIAQKYVSLGNYFWNAGIFIWNSKSIRKAFENLAPDINVHLSNMRQELASGIPLEKVLEKHFHQIPKISIDYSVLEKSSNIVMIKASFDWDDVGDWLALERHYAADEQGNIVKGSVMFIDSQNNITLSNEAHTIACIGVKDLVIVHTADATLICHKSQTQNIKKLQLSENLK